MNKKKLDPTDITGMVDELDQSGFFRQPTIPQEFKQQAPLIKKSDEQTNRRTDDTETRRSDDTTKRRIIKRQAMDFYKDQLETLKNHSLREELAGRRIGISQMLREALDEYIAKHKLKTDETTK